MRAYLTAAAFTLALVAPLDAAAECEVVDSGAIRCDQADAQVLRDKARAFGLFCEQLPSEVVAEHLSTELAALCSDVSHVSSIYADAQTKRKHAAAARKAQREANVAKGRVGELRGRVDVLQSDLSSATASAARWKVLAGIASGIAAGFGVVVAGSAAGWWEL